MVSTTETPVPVITEIDPQSRFSLTLCLSIIFHALLILGISFVPEEPQQSYYETLEVTMVQMQSEAPKKADLLAQANLEGGGAEEEIRHAADPQAKPLLAEEPQPPSPETPPEPVPTVTPPIPESVPEPQPEMVEEKAVPPQPEEVAVQESTQTPENSQPESERLLSTTEENPEHQVEKQPVAQEKPAEKQATATSPPKPEKKRRARISATELLSNSFRIASLNAELRRKMEAKAKRPRRKFISASTHQYDYAAYMAQWRSKVERIGNLNYPEEARRKGIAGTLMLDVALNPDGTVNSVSIRRSSGNSMLDNAAIRIVRLAAPYSPFPENIRRETDILHIIRSWKFVNNQFTQ